MKDPPTMDSMAVINQAQHERLPPTQVPLRETIMGVNFQALVWNLDTVAEPDLPSPEEFSWKEEGGQWLPVMTHLLPAPEAIVASSS